MEEEESEYEDEEESMWADDSEKEERTTESNPEDDSSLMEEENFERVTSRLEDETIYEDVDEELAMVELEEGEKENIVSGRIFEWDEEGGEYEYPGEYHPSSKLETAFPEDEKSKTSMQQKFPDAGPDALKPASRSTISSEPSKGSHRVKIVDSKEKKQIIDRLKIVKPKQYYQDRREECEKKMRKWLNRDNNQQPTESFLGLPYSGSIRSLDRLDDPCSHLFPKKLALTGNQGTVNLETTKTDSDVERRPMCACHGKIEDPIKQQTIPPEEMTKEHSRSQLSSGVISDEEIKRIKCTCGQSEECFGMGRAAEESAVESPCETEPTTEESANDLGRRPAPCTCDIKDAVGREKVEDEDAELREKLHHLMTLWFELKQRVCHCRKRGWMTTRVWERRKKKKCICRNLRKKRKNLQQLMKEVREGQVDKRIEMAENEIRQEKINELFAMIGPTLAAEFKELSERPIPRKKMESDSFTRMVMNEFGGQLRKYRMENMKDGSTFREHRRDDFDSLQYVELPNGSQYYGQFSRLGMEGKCIYKMVHGPIFVGSMLDGKMEGYGHLIYPNGGIVEGTWVNGTLFDPKYTFSDGLKFEPYNWKYCRMPDRRFVSEIINGMNSPDNVRMSADHPARQLPKGCLDAGEGFYDPQKRVIIHPSTGKVVRIVGEQEGNWILQNCRREWFEEVPFSRYMYENWYAGTVFPPPGDEPEWFNKEYAKILLPYTNVGDVVQARRLAMMNASKPHEKSASAQHVLPPMSLN